MFPQLLAAATAILYGISTWQIARCLLDRNVGGGLNLPLKTACVAIISHLLLIILLGTTQGQLTFQFTNAMSMISWVVTTLLVLLSLREPVASLGIALFPLAAVAAIASALAPQSTQLEQLEHGVTLHIVVSVVAYGILMVSAAQACVLAIQNNRLHTHHAGGFVRKLPPLASMEALLFRLIGAGFVLLSLALISGLLFLDDMFAQHLVHKTILSLLAWIIFGVLIAGRSLAGWRGRTAVRWTLTGNAVLILAYVGSKFVSEVLLEQ